MNKPNWLKGRLSVTRTHDEVSSIAPSEAGTEVSVRRRIKYGRPVQLLWGLFSEYSSNSTIHGFRYLGERRRPLAERIWWIIVFGLSIYACGSLILNVYLKWDMSPVIVSFAEKSTPVWQIPFPAVTICPETKSRIEYLDITKGYHIGQVGPPYNISEEELRRLTSVTLICDPHLFLNASLGNDTTDASCVADIREIAPSFEDMLLLCKWRNVVMDCSNLFSEILTEEGVCYSFNVLAASELFREDSIHDHYIYLNNTKESKYWSLESGYSKDAGQNAYPERVLGAGARAGLFVLLHLYEKDLDYICRGPVQGFKILLHTPGEIPQVSKQYFRIPLSQEVVVSVRPNMITTSVGLKHYEPSRRQCFFNTERYLKFFQVYTQQNCELECLANYTLSQCGCVRFSMPHDSETPVCGAAKIQCFNDAEDSLLAREFQEGLEDSNENYRGVTSCNCLPACTSIQYEAEMSQADFDWDKLFRAYDKPVNETVGMQLSRLTIFFKETQFLTSKRSELYGQTDFLAAAGGLLGLFMGVSLLSLVEILYFCTIRLMCNLGMRKRKSRKIARLSLITSKPPGIVVDKESNWENGEMDGKNK